MRSDGTWKCLGYPSQTLKLLSDLTKKLNSLYYADDFDRHELGPDWGVIHYDGSGSVALNGFTVSVSAGGSGDFYTSPDTGSMIYKTLPTDWTAVEVSVINVADGLRYQRLLMVRAGIEANAPYYGILPDGDNSHITTVWRDSYGATATAAGENTGVTWDRTKPLRVRIERDGTTLTAKLSYDNGVTWQTIGSRIMPEMKYACLCAIYTGVGYVVYDNFAILGASANIIRTENGFQLATVPGNGEYISPQFSLYSFKATGTPVISWDASATGVTCDVDISLDGGTTWSGWQPVSNGASLPGVDTSTNLDGVKFRYRLIMSSDNAVSPVVSNIRIENITDWTDVLYDDSSWVAVYDNGAYGVSPWTTQVVNWPDSQARWIWDRASTSSAPAGDVYFRKRFTLTEPKWVTVAFACDDKAKLYVDGQYLLGNANWKSTFANTIYLPAGEHVIAVKGTNSAAGTAGLLVTVRDTFPGLVGAGTMVGIRLARVFEGLKAAVLTFGLRQVRNLVANVYVVDIFNTGPSTKKVGDYFLGVRSAIDQETPRPPPPGDSGTAVPVRRFPFSWVPFVHQRWKPKQQ